MKKIKLKIAHWLLKHKQKKLRRTRAAYNFDTAQTVGVLFSLDDADAYQTIKEFLDFLADKKLQTYTLGYCNHKDIPDKFVGHSQINAFTVRDLNWYNIPKSHLVKQFMDKKFDILFDLTSLDQFPPKYINNLSKARFKVGKESNNGKEHDMMISMGENKELRVLIDHIKYYISRINKAEQGYV